MENYEDREMLLLTYVQVSASHGETFWRDVVFYFG